MPNCDTCSEGQKEFSQNNPKCQDCQKIELEMRLFQIREQLEQCRLNSNMYSDDIKDDLENYQNYLREIEQYLNTINQQICDKDNYWKNISNYLKDIKEMEKNIEEAEKNSEEARYPESLIDRLRDAESRSEKNGNTGRTNDPEISR